MPQRTHFIKRRENNKELKKLSLCAECMRYLGNDFCKNDLVEEDCLALYGHRLNFFGLFRFSRFKDGGLINLLRFNIRIGLDS